MNKQDAPIIFGDESIRAILAGRKTQTRQLVQRPMDEHSDDFRLGMTIWVRESYCVQPDGSALYRADGPKPRVRVSVDYLREHNISTSSRLYWNNGKCMPIKLIQLEYDNMNWRTPIYMPRRYSRIELIVTDVRMERIQCIERRPEDIAAEGICDAKEPIAAFAQQWDRAHARKRPYAVNPYVFVIDFIALRIKNAR